MRRANIGILSVLPDSELGALLRAFGLSPPDEIKRGTERYWETYIYSAPLSQELGIALTAIGAQGNPDAAAATTSLIDHYQPDAVLLVGIAAGLEGHVALGDVLYSKVVIGYEPSKLTPSTVLGEPEYKTAHFQLHQDLEHLRARTDPYELVQAISSNLDGLASEQLPPAELAPTKVSLHSSVIAAGEKIFADGSLAELNDRYHRRLYGGEKEGIGFALAAERKGVPWAVIRGVSDFGTALSKDDRYKDRFHHFASAGAATVARRFAEQTYSLENKSDIQAVNIFKGIPTLHLQRVLFTVSDRSGLDQVLQYFQETSVQVVATPNTRAAIVDLGVECIDTFEYTQCEPLSFIRGTLHPYILASILAGRHDQEKMGELQAHNLDSIDIIFVNTPDLRIDPAMPTRAALDQVANLQIGGPSLLRWGLKQWKTCATVVDPGDYTRLLEHLKDNDNRLLPDMRLFLLRRALAYLHDKDRQTTNLLYKLQPGI